LDSVVHWRFWRSVFCHEVAMTEYDEQLTVFDFAHGYAGNLEPRLKMLHAVENTKGSGRPPAGSEQSAGVPDMFLAVPVAPFHGLYIENENRETISSAKTLAKGAQNARLC
jgi:hypothetical protein